MVTKREQKMTASLLVLSSRVSGHNKKKKKIIFNMQTDGGTTLFEWFYLYELNIALQELICWIHASIIAFLRDNFV